MSAEEPIKPVTFLNIEDRVLKTVGKNNTAVIGFLGIVAFAIIIATLASTMTPLLQVFAYPLCAFSFIACAVMLVPMLIDNCRLVFGNVINNYKNNKGVTKNIKSLEAENEIESPKPRAENNIEVDSATVKTSRSSSPVSTPRKTSPKVDDLFTEADELREELSDSEPSTPTTPVPVRTRGSIIPLAQQPHIAEAMRSSLNPSSNANNVIVENNVIVDSSPLPPRAYNQQQNSISSPDTAYVYGSPQLLYPNSVGETNNHQQTSWESSFHQTSPQQSTRGTHAASVVDFETLLTNSLNAGTPPNYKS